MSHHRYLDRFYLPSHFPFVPGDWWVPDLLPSLLRKVFHIWLEADILSVYKMDPFKQLVDWYAVCRPHQPPSNYIDVFAYLINSSLSVNKWRVTGCALQNRFANMLKQIIGDSQTYFATLLIVNIPLYCVKVYVLCRGGWTPWNQFSIDEPESVLIIPTIKSASF